MHARRFVLLSALVLVACGSPSAPPGPSSGEGGAAASPWRSALYPDDWTPAFTDADGRFLHDFSYAGHRRGEIEPGAPESAAIFDVTAAHAADRTGATDATTAVQMTIDDAAKSGGGVVFFPAGDYKFDGILSITTSSVVLRGEGPTKSRLLFTRALGMSNLADVTFAGTADFDLDLALASDATPRADTIEVADAKDMNVGDEIEIGWVITPAFIEEHGMTGTWKAFNDTWQTFFRRNVVSIDRDASPHRIRVDVPLRYPAKTRDGASVRRALGLIRECGFESLGVSNAVSWDDAWTMNQTHVLTMNHVVDGWVRDVASYPSPLAPAMGPGSGAHLASSGIMIEDSARTTVEAVRLGLAQNRGGGGNGYSFELRRSNEVLVKDSQGDGGRHNFIQNWGFGTTGCVFLRVESRNGVSLVNQSDTLGLTGLSEFHHSLATANLIDSSTFDDGFSIVNRNGESTGAGHTGTENVLWNLEGKGMLRSMQFGMGYVIGTRGLYVVTESPLPMGTGTLPVDFTEGEDATEEVSPPSLYEDQRARRLGK